MLLYDRTFVSGSFREALRRRYPLYLALAATWLVLAGALGANLVRTVATQTRTQFEQFFSPELTRELERDPNLLEGLLQLQLSPSTQLGQRKTNPAAVLP